MANFCLWFYLLYVIFKWLIWQFWGKEEITKNLKSVLLWVLVAWVWVQASRFLTSVVIDVSTITLSAVGAFPSQVLSKNERLNKWIQVSMSDFNNRGSNVVDGQLRNLFPENGAANSFVETTKIPLNKSVTNEELFDSLMPNKDDVSGPLYYMWVAILRTNEVPSVASDSEPSAKRTILNLIIKWWTTIVYAIEMMVLCVIALMRILYLWMFIVLSPFAILLACIQKAWEKELLAKWFISNLMKQINLKTFLAKVFQPAIIVLWISLAMIFATLISAIVNENKTKSMEDFSISWAKISTLRDEKMISQSEKDVTYTTRLDSNLLSLSISTVWKWLLDLIMAILTVILVYEIISMSVKIWNSIWGGQDWLSKKVDSVQKWVTWLMTSVPIIPVAWYDKEWVRTTNYMSIGTAKQLGEKKIRQYSWVIEDEYRNQTDIISSWFGEKDEIVSLSYVDRQAIKDVVIASDLWLARLTKQFDKIIQFGNRKKEERGLNKNEWYWMMLNPESKEWFWRNTFKDWLTEMKDSTKRWTINDSTWEAMIDWWNTWTNSNGDQALENLFKQNETKNVKAYAKLFNLWDNIDTWDELKNIDISKKS